MASRTLIRFSRKRRRDGRQDERETELTLSVAVVPLIVILLLVVLVAAGLIPADLLSEVIVKTFTR